MKPRVHCQELFEIVAVDIWKHNFSISWDLSVSVQRLVCSLSCIQHRRQHYILYGSMKIANHFLMYFCLKFITHDEKSSIFKVFEKSNVTLQTFLCLLTDHPMRASQVWGNYETTCTLPRTVWNCGCPYYIYIYRHNFSISWNLSVSVQWLARSHSGIPHRRQHYIPILSSGFFLLCTTCTSLCTNSTRNLWSDFLLL